ncbi:phosphatase [Virgibacillus sp. MSP4-1]|uniref:FIMAH domain-containing protein n=1 Tax=Virgibacillus sp. MSP4-1 TaxID=2700081 RepID=UPI0003A65541|nr:metallophosphoesterase [Virgibacillus sp. MSP4-1]QHS23786.1 phosphatase [Virgibacillus sp. MSP4-1]
MSKIFQKNVLKLIVTAILVFSIGMTSSPWNAQAEDHLGDTNTSSEEPNLVFPVISDTQLGRAEGDPERFEDAMKQLNQLAPEQDAIAFLGDLTSHGVIEEYETWSSIFNEYVQPEAEQLIGIGNHEYNYNGLTPEKSQERFFDYTGMESLYYHKNIKGYDFIMMGEERGYFYSKDQVQWLGDQLEQAEKRDSNKPIFVFLHHGIKDTTYGTEDWYIENDNQKLLRETLKKYPQVILIAGHTHYPISDPRSIHQEDYTAVNSGSIAYMWTEKGYIQGEVPEAEVSNGLLVKVYDDEVVIKRRNFTGERWVEEPWVIDTPVEDTADFKYTDDRDQVSPYFYEDSNIDITETTTNSLSISFPQAFDNLLTHSYQVTAKNQETGEIVNQYKAFSEYYKGEVPSSLEFPVNNLDPATTYQIGVQAIDAFGNVSDQITTTATTLTENVAEMQEVIGQFENHGAFANHGVAQSLKAQLNSVNKFVQKDATEKAIKHMNDAKSLLENRQQNNQISESAYNYLTFNIDHLIKQWK